MNGHYLAASWQDDMIRFYAYHNLCDSRGFIPWFKTVLYLYLVKTADPSLSRESVNLPGNRFFRMRRRIPIRRWNFPKIYSLSLKRNLFRSSFLTPVMRRGRDGLIIMSGRTAESLRTW